MARSDSFALACRKSHLLKKTPEGISLTPKHWSDQTSISEEKEIAQFEITVDESIQENRLRAISLLASPFGGRQGTQTLVEQVLNQVLALQVSKT